MLLTSWGHVLRYPTKVLDLESLLHKGDGQYAYDAACRSKGFKQGFLDLVMYTDFDLSEGDTALYTDQHGRRLALINTFAGNVILLERSKPEACPTRGAEVDIVCYAPDQISGIVREGTLTQKELYQLLSPFGGSNIGKALKMLRGCEPRTLESYQLRNLA